MVHLPPSFATHPAQHKHMNNEGDAKKNQHRPKVSEVERQVLTEIQMRLKKPSRYSQIANHD